MGHRAAGVADAVWRRSPTQVVLVIDDVHDITPGTGGADRRDLAMRTPGWGSGDPFPGACTMTEAT